MLRATGKAAVIHPTGTGKSFIAFKLCEDHLEKTVCRLSPSSYIFKTQLENLRKAGSGDSGNIRFFTYARLMNMTPGEIAAIQPDYIILDEFHRCGAEVWGQGVQNLLTSVPDTPVLGLSATDICYLYNQRDMIAMTPEWFSRVDDAPHIYSAYSDDPETDHAFTAFKADGSNHLKLLYCIDMLNEGIHVNDVGGVILLRPTVSPVIYKQQIGRALAAGKKKNTAIFDIVLNIENLYSIDSITEEMQIVTTYYRSLEMDGIGMVWDVPNYLWEENYIAAVRNHRTHGHLNVPTNYVDPDSVRLGVWLNSLRTSKKADPEAKNMLASVGIIPEGDAV